MTPRGEMSAALGAVALGALVALVAAGQPRVSTGLAGEQVAGADTPVAGALSLVALAGAAAVLLLQSRARRVVGGTLTVVAVGIVTAFLAPDESFTDGVFTGSPDDIEVARSVWAWLGMSGGLLVAIGALGVAVRAGRWPEPRRRYESAAPHGDRTSDPWDAIDRGEDPTT